MAEQEILGENARTMLEDELNFLHNYGPCSRPEDCTLLAGHLRLVEALLSADGVSTDEVGRNVISDLLDSHLFPASKVERVKEWQRFKISLFTLATTPYRY